MKGAPTRRRNDATAAQYGAGGERMLDLPRDILAPTHG